MRRRIGFVIMTTLILVATCIRCFAQDEFVGAGSDILTYNDFDAVSIFDAVPDEILKELPDGAEEFDAEKIAGSADPLFFIRAILDSAAKMLKPTLNFFAKMLGIVVISAAIGAVGGVTNSESIREVAGIVTKMCLIAAMSENILSLIDETADYIKLVTGVGEAAVPVFSAICIAGGNVTGATVAANGMLIALNFIGILTGQALFPVVRVCLALTTVAGLGAEKLGFRIEEISKFVRKTMCFILALISATISGVMSFQSIIAARVDSLSLRAVKFAASAAVPVAGSIAADAAGTIAGSISLVKNAVGWVGIIVIILIISPIMVKLLLNKLAIVLISTISGLLEFGSAKTMIDEVSGIINFICAVCTIASLTLIYELTVISRTMSGIAV